MSPAALLEQGIACMSLALSDEVQKKLLAYMALLQKWNKVYNLTAVRDPLEMVTLHLLDSLSVLPYVNSKNLLDVGSGGGLPGVVLAICKPELQVTTIDAVQKKVIFMRQVKGELGLDNLTPVHARVEDFKPVAPFEIVISRAFSEIALFINLTKHLIAENGQWLAMKGVMPADELEGLPLAPKQVIVLKVPDLDAERHLLVFNNTYIKA
ncbi:GidB Predicted S-adenosylmethionine-dependent methyltransferase involved in bacterial cell division [Methylophilaceae bacterium]